MNFVTFGQKKNPAVLFMHGWGGSIASWLGVAKVIAGFGFYSIVVDFRGFGESPEPNEPYGVEEYANDVTKLLNELKINKVSLVGHSFGGRVGIMLAAKKTIKIEKLVLVDSAGIKPRRGIKYKLNVYRYKRAKRDVAAGKRSADVLEKFGSNDYKALSPVMKRTFINVVNLDLLPYAKEIEVETLLVWGKYDKDTPLYMAKKLKKVIKNSSLIVYPAGHYSYIDKFRDFIDELYAFLIC